MKKKTKSTTINLLGGKQVRIIKSEVIDVQEQRTLFGGGLTSL